MAVNYVIKLDRELNNRNNVLELPAIMNCACGSVIGKTVR